MGRHKTFVQCRFFTSVKSSYSTQSSPNIVSEIPCVKQIPLLRNILPVEFLLNGGAENLHEFIDKRHQQLGPIFREQFGPVRSIFVSDASAIRKIFANEGKYPKHVIPDALLFYNQIKNYKRGLFFMDGEEWLECRKVLNRILLKPFPITPQVNDFFTNYFETWHENLNNGEIMDLEKRLYNLAIIFTVLHLMGDSFVAHSKTFTPLAHKLASVVGEIFQWSVKLFTVPASLAKSCGFNSWKNFVSSMDESIKISSDLMDAMKNLNWGNGIIREMRDNGISEDRIRTIVADFMLAAGDTIATTLQWTLYLLGVNTEIQEQIFQELKNQEDYEQVSLLKNSIRESMRLYPVAPFISRYLPTNIQIENYTIAAGVTIVKSQYNLYKRPGRRNLASWQELISMSMYTCSRNDRYFPEADKFNPNRWIRRTGNSHYQMVNDPYATLPYSFGSRSCIGKKLAQAHLIMTVGKLISMYELRAINRVGIKLRLVMVPSEPVRLQIKKRS